MLNFSRDPDFNFLQLYYALNSIVLILQFVFYFKFNLFFKLLIFSYSFSLNTLHILPAFCLTHDVSIVYLNFFLKPVVIFRDHVC